MLYSPVIRDRFRHPRFFGDLEAADAVFEDVNPLCGDRVRIQLRFDDSRIAEARFKGDSCAICMASADLLVEMARGRAVAEVERLGPDALLGRLEATIRPSRMTCVTLPLHVLKGALAGVGAAR